MTKKDCLSHLVTRDLIRGPPSAPSLVGLSGAGQPGRADAMVWAMTELFEKERVEPRISCCEDATEWPPSKPSIHQV